MDARPAPARVYHASYGRLVSQMFAMSGGRQEAEDAVQEAFVKAIGRGDRWPGIENLEAWLRIVALNHLRNRWRRLNPSPPAGD